MHDIKPGMTNIGRPCGRLLWGAADWASLWSWTARMNPENNLAFVAGGVFRAFVQFLAGGVALGLTKFLVRIAYVAMKSRVRLLAFGLWLAPIAVVACAGSREYLEPVAGPTAVSENADVASQPSTVVVKEATCTALPTAINSTPTSRPRPTAASLTPTTTVVRPTPTSTAARNASVNLATTPAGWAQYAGSDVNTLTSSYSYRHVDIATKEEAGPALAFMRTYNGNYTRFSSLGQGWMHSYEIRLAYGDSAGKSVYTTGPMGRTEMYRVSPGGSFTPERSTTKAVLLPKAPGSILYTVKHPDGTVWSIRNDGKLQSIDDVSGKRTTLHYDARGEAHSH